MAGNDWLDGKVPGSISYANWQAYSWKNELSTQFKRALAHCQEILDEDFDGQHNPHDVLERALVLAAFCVRRLVEKRLVTDDFAKTQIALRTFEAIQDQEFRLPFHSQSGGNFFNNYDYEIPVMRSFTTKELADEIIHSSQLMVISAGVRPAGP